MKVAVTDSTATQMTLSVLAALHGRRRRRRRILQVSASQHSRLLVPIMAIMFKSS